MITEVNLAKSFLIEKFGSVKNVKPGIYSVPKGDAFMRVEITEDMGMKDFRLFKDEELTISHV